MLPFTAAELSQMRETQDDAMQDTCYVLAYSSTTDGYGNPTATYTAGSALICGVEMVRPDEQQASGNVPRVDALIRLPLATALDPRDRIRVSKRYAETVTSVDYELVGPAKRGPSGLVVECVKAVR
jgi:hypothetical protein